MRTGHEGAGTAGGDDLVEGAEESRQGRVAPGFRTPDCSNCETAVFMSAEKATLCEEEGDSDLVIPEVPTSVVKGGTLTD